MFLSKISIYNFKGIKELIVKFDPDINIIIGENGSNKTALIDAIRILFNIGKPYKDYYISNDDFHYNFQTRKTEKIIELIYEFEGLTDEQKGAFYEFLVIVPGGEDIAKVHLKYELRDNKYPLFSYHTGNSEGQKADYRNFELFQHYYLGALRDSTTDLLNTKYNLLGSVINRIVEREGSQEEIKEIIKGANEKLLVRPEVTETRDNVNKNLDNIFKEFNENKIGLQIEQSKVENIVKIIKPFLPFDKSTLRNEGFNLSQNSLGFNNLIYIATVLGDINERVKREEKISSFALLIEEPEAHLHPQLQLSLFNFLKEANNPKNCQLFISSHSPVLTSKASLENLIILDSNALMVSNCFKDRAKERIIEKTPKKKEMTEEDFQTKKIMLERYLDVTKSQLFFSKGILFVEGISEELLIYPFANLLGCNLQDYRIEVVNVGGTSFYPFIYLFNSTDKEKRLNKPASIITDDDRFSKSKLKDYSFKNLSKNDFSKLDAFHTKLKTGTPSTRISNLKSISSKRSKSIKIFPAVKTLEYEIALANVNTDKALIFNNMLIKYIEENLPKKFLIIKSYIDIKITSSTLSVDEREKTAILVWKSLPSKASFAQEFAEKLRTKSAVELFVVPGYIERAINHIKTVLNNGI